MKLRHFSLVLVAVFSSSIGALATQYPADYEVRSEEQTQGSVAVMRSLQLNYDLAALDNAYKGPLLGRPGLQAWVQVNYNDGPHRGIFAFNPPQAGGFAELRITGGCLASAPDDACAVPGTKLMNYLLLFAQQGDTLNALDVEIAITDGQGNWDSNNGNNYRFKFDQF